MRLLDTILIWLLKLLPAKYGQPVTEKLRASFERLSSNDAQGKSARAAGLIFAIRVFSAVLAFVLQVFLARWMGDTQYGVFVLVWVIAIVLGGLSCFGLQTAVIRFITQYRTNGYEALLRGVLLAAPMIVIGTSMLVAGCGLLVIYSFPDLVSEIYVMPFYLVLVCLPLLALEEIQEGIARSYDLPLIALGPVFILRPAGILVLMAGAWLAGFEANAVVAMSAAVIASLISTLCQSIMLWSRIKVAISTEFLADKDQQSPVQRKYQSPVQRKYQMATWAKVALPVFMAGGFYNLQANIDVMFVGYFLSPEKVAVYFASLKVLAFVHFVHFALRSASAHHFSRYYSNNDMDGLAGYARKIAQWSFWPTLVLASIMVLAGKYILAMFGPQFVDGQVLLVILAAGIVARSTMGPAESLLSMTGQQNKLVLVLAATLLCNIALNIVLIPVFGVMGAAIATCIAMVFESAALYAAVHRYLGLHLFIVGAGKPGERKGHVA